MALKPPTSRITESLTVRDLISVVSVAVSITLAWGIFGSRLTVLEKDSVSIKAEVETHDKQIRTLENQAQANQFYIDELYVLLEKPHARRLDKSTR